MDDQPAKKPSEESINKIDLSALERFEFGTQWSEATTRPRDRDDADARGGRAYSPSSGSPPARRDRRPPRRSAEPAGAGARDNRGPDRRERSDRGQRQPMSGPRDSNRPPPRPRDDDRGGSRQRRPRQHSGPPRPYESPVFEITIYPDDHGFEALVKAMRASYRTYELFEIARLILAKPERCVVVFKRRKPSPEAKAEPLHVSVPDGLPFATEEEAIRHVMDKHMERFFSMETVEVDPPKGNFQFVNRCPITKKLLGPPNYHRYAHVLRHHYDTHRFRQPFEDYKASIEVVREPEMIQEWIESAKQATRCTFKGQEGAEPVVFENPEDARTHLLSNCRDQLVKQADTSRVPGKVVTESGNSEAFRAFRGAVEAQRRFPLDAANALRGRLRRENFHIFKRGSKGVTYVCAIRRRFRRPGEVFSDSITRLVEFLDTHPKVSIADLPEKFLGFALPHDPRPAPQAAPEPTPSDAEATEEAPRETAEDAVQAPAALTPEQKSALDRMLIDLRWLVGEGYVAEYSDGRLYVHPVMAPAGAKESSSEPDAEMEDEHNPGEESVPAAEPSSPDEEPSASTAEEPKLESGAETESVQPEPPTEPPEASTEAQAGDPPSGFAEPEPESGSETPTTETAPPRMT